MKLSWPACSTISANSSLRKSSPRNVSRWLKESMRANCRIHEAELDIFGTTHAQVGGLPVGDMGFIRIDHQNGGLSP